MEAPIAVYYGGEIIGEYYADLLVAGKVIVELKAVKEFAPEHEAQLLTYLKATPYEVGLLLNIGPTAQKKRLAYDNSRKGTMKWTTNHYANSGHYLQRRYGVYLDYQK